MLKWRIVLGFWSKNDIHGVVPISTEMCGGSLMLADIRGYQRLSAYGPRVSAVISALSDYFKYR